MHITHLEASGGLHCKWRSAREHVQVLKSMGHLEENEKMQFCSGVSTKLRTSAVRVGRGILGNLGNMSIRAASLRCAALDVLKINRSKMSLEALGV